MLFIGDGFSLLHHGCRFRTSVRLARSPAFHKLVLAASLTRHYRRVAKYETGEWWWNSGRPACFETTRMTHLDLSDCLQPGRAIWIVPVLLLAVD